jgi:dTDP-glucose 4,6-dehydratase
LVALGARTRALIRYNSANSWGWLDASPIRSDIQVILGDVRDQESLRQAVQGVDIIFHLAALVAIPYSYHAPLSYVRTNVEGTLNVLQAAMGASANLVVHISTSEVYGTARYTPIDEAHPQQSQSPYSASKIGADKLAEAFHLSFSLPIVTVRPFNTFGPRQSARAVIPAIITQCLAGETVRLGNLHPTRDLNYVANMVDGFLLAATTPAAVGQTINLGSGREISIGELARLIGCLSGQSIVIERESERIRPDQSEVERLLADNTLARMLLGWEPTVSLEDGLQRTIEWMQMHLKRYRPNVYVL